MKNAIRLFVLVTAILIVVQLCWWYPNLPDIVPGHFNVNGDVDREMTKNGMIGLMAGLHVFLLGGLLLMGWAVRLLPNDMINIPNRDYWLAPERREATLAETSDWLNLIGGISSWLIMATFHLTCLVAIEERVGIAPEIWIIVGIYMMIIFGFCFYSFRRYRLPDGKLAPHSQMD